VEDDAEEKMNVDPVFVNDPWAHPAAVVATQGLSLDTTWTSTASERGQSTPRFTKTRCPPTSSPPKSKRQLKVSSSHSAFLAHDLSDHDTVAPAALSGAVITSEVLTKILGELIAELLAKINALESKVDVSTSQSYDSASVVRRLEWMQWDIVGLREEIVDLTATVVRSGRGATEERITAMQQDFSVLRLVQSSPKATAVSRGACSLPAEEEHAGKKLKIR
jgi:hypothetical protein